MGWIKRAWRGEERLWKVFWIYGVLMGIVFGLVGPIARSAFGNIGFIVALVIQVIYWIWLLVAQWRCAFNAEWQIWSYVVRIFVVISLSAIPLALFGGVMIGQDLIKAAECRKELQAYVAKGGTDVEGFKKQCIARQTHTDAESTQDSTATSSSPGILDAIKAGIECSKEGQGYQKNGGTDVKEFEQKCIKQHLHKGDATQPADSSAAAPPVMLNVPPDQQKYKQTCEKTMTDVATKSGVDPTNYIAQNQAYLQQCIQYYAGQDAANSHKSP